MSLEKLLDSNNIVDLRPIEAKPRGFREKFEDLKKSLLYDDKWGLWNCEMFNWGTFLSRDQLLGIMIETISDKKKGQNHYEELKKGSLYDEWGGWNSCVHKENGVLVLDSSLYFSQSQLMALFVEGVFDKSKDKVNTRNKFEELKRGPLFERGRWLWADDKKGLMNYLNRYVKDQLWGVAVEAIFDKQGAERHFDELKSSFYDTELGEWERDVSKDGKISSPSKRRPQDQLTGIFVQAIFDKEEAGKQYRKLKKGHFYDHELDVIKKNPDVPWDGRRCSEDHLLEILIEGTLEEDIFSFEKGLEVPILRSF